MRKLPGLVLVAVLLAGTANAADAIKRIGVTVGSIGNPGFVAMVDGVNAAVKEYCPDALVTVVSADYDLSKQSQQVDDFISAGMDVIILNAVDVEGIAPAVKRIKEAGITVVAMDVGAEGGVDGTVTSDNIAAGRIAGEYLAKRLNYKGNVVILAGPPATSLLDRVSGANQAFAKYPGIKVLSDNQNGLAQRDESYRIMGDLLTTFPETNAVFGCNDPTGLGCELAIKQAGRTDILVAAVDGGPDSIEAMKLPGALFVASSAQQIRNLGYMSMHVAVGLREGKQLKNEPTLIPVHLVTLDNLADWPTWGPIGADVAGVEVWK